VICLSTGLCNSTDRFFKKLSLWIVTSPKSEVGFPLEVYAFLVLDLRFAGHTRDDDHDDVGFLSEQVMPMDLELAGSWRWWLPALCSKWITIHSHFQFL
jgi:hypothetical protein